MMRCAITMILLAGVATWAGASENREPDEKKKGKRQKLPAFKPKPITSREPVKELPKGLRRFNGMLVGRLLTKDVEKGTFVVHVDRVSRVWRNSKAENPKSAVGRNIVIDGVSGKWLDVLLLVKKDQTMEFEARHDRGNKLTFPGEMMRKVAPVKPGEYPELPEGFRRFRGAVTAKIVRKDVEMLEMIVQVSKVNDVFQNNRAKKPESIVGKKMILAGFWRRKEDYGKLKPGDTILTGVHHISPRSDHVSVAEFIRKVKSSQTKAKKKPRK